MNRKWCLCFFAGVAFTGRSWSAGTPNQASGLALPESIRSTLNAEYPGWTLAPVNPQIQSVYKQRKINHSPSVAAGDFDVDGKRDYVIQIALNTPGQEEQIIIVFLARGDHFEETILQSMGIDPSYYLWVKQTSIDETGSNPDKPVKKDVIMVLGGPVGETAYSCDEGKFHEINSPDDSEKPDLTIPRVPPSPDPAPEKVTP